MEIWYDREGKPISMLDWERLKLHTVTEDGVPYHRIGIAHVGDVEVSTVWLGIDHNFIHPGPPIIFETMIFGGPMDTECWRYSTEEAARAGHAEVVALVRADMQLHAD